MKFIMSSIIGLLGALGASLLYMILFSPSMNAAIGLGIVFVASFTATFYSAQLTD